jgi:methylenetetrahydrofolate dehydrogenase (NADP+)/methenyltetrahydrofolate cyclohydrolase
MPAQILDGKALAAQIRENLKKRVEKLKQESGLTPGLAAVLVGENPASKVYVNIKEKTCQEIGVKSERIELPESTHEQQLIDLVMDLNERQDIHGILVQLPLPKGLNEKKILDYIDPAKDVDGFHYENMGQFFLGKKTVVPCTPKGIMALIESTKQDLTGRHAVVVGRSNTVGKPVALLLLEKNCTVSICHSRTKDLGEMTRQADILVAAVGKPHLITKEMVKEGAIVIDVGINRVDGKLKGDDDFEADKEKAAFITPVPGGVGPMTVAMLLETTLEIAEKAVKGKAVEGAGGTRA